MRLLGVGTLPEPAQGSRDIFRARPLRRRRVTLPGNEIRGPLIDGLIPCGVEWHGWGSSPEFDIAKKSRAVGVKSVHPYHRRVSGPCPPRSRFSQSYSRTFESSLRRVDGFVLVTKAMDGHSRVSSHRLMNYLRAT